jgi:hypothetical protein
MVNLGCNTLPVELLSFSGKNVSTGNMLNWTTATETNNKYFTLERSVDGFSFNTIGKVNSLSVNGNSTTSLSYSFLDKDIKPGTYYYRLSQTDIDGTTKKYDPIAIHVKEKENEISIIPNPSFNTAEVNYYCNDNEAAVLKVFDHSGSLVVTRQINCFKGENKYVLDLNTEGIYLVTITTGSDIYKARFIKLKLS